MLPKSAKNKVAFSGNQTHNTNHLWIKMQMLIPLFHPDMCWIEDPSWTSIIYRFNRAWLFRGLKSETGQEWQIGWVCKVLEL